MLGSYGPWIINFMFWIISCNLILQSLLLLTHNKIFSLAGFILCCTHLPLIGYSLHALTEVTAFFLLSILIYIIAKNIQRIGAIETQLKILFTVSLLAATKPVYQLAWYIFVFYIVLYYFRSFWNIRIILLLLLASSPVLIQKSITVIQHNTLSSTQIADSNLKKYFYRKTRHYVNSGIVNYSDSMTDSAYPQELKKTGSISTPDVVLYLVRHPKHTTLTFLSNLQENIGGGYPYVDVSRNAIIARWAGYYNKAWMYLHIPFFISWLAFIIVFRKREKIGNKDYLFILFSGLLLYYIYFTSGLVFGSGDRLIAPATSLWICCYLVFGHTLFLYRKHTETHLK